MSWKDLIKMARGVFWPKLLHGSTLERFCARHLPHRFSDLRLPFAAIATALPAKRAIAITTGHLASAINASCAMRVIRGPRASRRAHIKGWRDRLRASGRCLPPDGRGLRDLVRRLGSQFGLARHGLSPCASPRASHLSGPLPDFAAQYRSARSSANAAGRILAERSGNRANGRRRRSRPRAARWSVLRQRIGTTDQMPEGNVSAGSPIFHSDVRSSGSTARV